MLLCAAGSHASGGADLAEVGRGHSWVSPYWGYNTPKIVCDGTAYYTAGIWGAFGKAEGVVYRHNGVDWRPGARLPGIYQPATLLVDPAGRLIVAHTRVSAPVRLLRAKTPGSIDDFEQLPAPPDMTEAYYIGVAIRGERLSIAYLSGTTGTMHLAQLDLATTVWGPSRVVQQGQVASKPKTAWTYPILVPSREGLHLAASNSPDGGDGNTYNRVWYLFYPDGAEEPAVREEVFECPVGHVAFAMDMTVSGDGTVHVVYLGNQRVYGEPLPEGAPPAGSYHAWRSSSTGRWHRGKVEAGGILGFYDDGRRVQLVGQRAGAFVPLTWEQSTRERVEGEPLCKLSAVPAGPSFVDVISPASGSDVSGGVALVSDGLLPERPDAARERVVWSLLPSASRSRSEAADPATP